MKNKIIGILAACLLAVSATAQTNTSIPDLTSGVAGQYPSLSHAAQEFYDAAIVTTNAAVVVVAGRGLTGNKNLVGASYIYNLNQGSDTRAGLVLGWDEVFSNDKRMGSAQSSLLKGGLQLSLDIQPLQRYGVTNFVLSPVAGYLVATPMNGSSNDGGLAQVAFTGFNWHSPELFWNVRANAGVLFENRSGQGVWDGNYLLIELALSKGF